MSQQRKQLGLALAVLVAAAAALQYAAAASRSTTRSNQAVEVEEAKEAGTVRGARKASRRGYASSKFLPLPTKGAYMHWKTSAATWQSCDQNQEKPNYFIYETPGEKKTTPDGKPTSKPWRPTRKRKWNHTRWEANEPS